MRTTVTVEAGGRVLPDVLEDFHREIAIFNGLGIFVNKYVGLV